MRAVIYARFSSDLQDERSIADQVHLARKYAETRGLAVIDVYQDAAISGASTINRPGLQRMLVDASASKFDIIVTESLDRLSRSQADIASLYEKLTFNGVRIETLADGAVSEIHVGLKGTMAALFLAVIGSVRYFAEPTGITGAVAVAEIVGLIAAGIGFRHCGYLAIGRASCRERVCSTV